MTAPTVITRLQASQKKRGVSMKTPDLPIEDPTRYTVAIDSRQSTHPQVESNEPFPASLSWVRLTVVVGGPPQPGPYG
jgi:hypothetical protein